MSNPAIASHPQAKPILDGGLKVYQDVFIAKLGVLATQFRVAALTVACNLSTQFSQMDVHQPQLANKRPQIVEPFGHEMWQERERALKADIEQWFEKIMVMPDKYSGSDNSTIQQRANHKEDSSLKNQDEEEEFKLEPVEYMSRAVNMGMTPVTTTPVYAMHADDYIIDGLPTNESLYSFNKLTPFAWLACASSSTRFAIDSRARSGYRMADGVQSDVMKMLTRDSVQVVFAYGSTPTVYVNGIKTGYLEHTIKTTMCSDRKYFTSRFIMSSETGFFYLSATNLVYYTWAGISKPKFDACSILQKDVIDFDLTSDSYVCITTRNTLTKDGDDISDIKSLPCHRHLTTIGIVGNHAVCSATVTDDTAVILAYDMNGVFESSVMIQVTKGQKLGNDGICWIKSAGVTHGHAAFIAVERHRYVHLVVIDSHGKLSVTSRVEMTKSHDTIMCVAAYDVEGRFIVSGSGWIKKISVKM